MLKYYLTVKSLTKLNETVAPNALSYPFPAKHIVVEILKGASLL